MISCWDSAFSPIQQQNCWETPCQNKCHWELYLSFPGLSGTECLKQHKKAPPGEEESLIKGPSLTLWLQWVFYNTRESQLTLEKTRREGGPYVSPPWLSAHFWLVRKPGPEPNALLSLFWARPRGHILALWVLGCVWDPCWLHSTKMPSRSAMKRVMWFGVALIGVTHWKPQTLQSGGGALKYNSQKSQQCLCSHPSVL